MQLTVERWYDLIMKAHPLARQPRVPLFNLYAGTGMVDVTRRLHEIIDAGGEQASIAYGALTRLCVLYAGPSLGDGSDALGGRRSRVGTELLQALASLGIEPV